MNKLRIHSNAVKIEVNDEGEYITLNFDDQAFLPGLAALIEKFEADMPQYEEQAKELDALPENTPDEKLSKMRKAFDFNLGIHKKTKEEIDKIFRDEVCRKVFGDIVPSVHLYAEFFDQLTPYINDYAKERASKMGKYAPMRTGNV